MLFIGLVENAETVKKFTPSLMLMVRCVIADRLVQMLIGTVVQNTDAALAGSPEEKEKARGNADRAWVALGNRVVASLAGSERSDDVINLVGSVSLSQDVSEKLSNLCLKKCLDRDGQGRSWAKALKKLVLKGVVTSNSAVGNTEESGGGNAADNWSRDPTLVGVASLLVAAVVSDVCTEQDLQAANIQALRDLVTEARSVQKGRSGGLFATVSAVLFAAGESSLRLNRIICSGLFSSLDKEK